eukprot:TRINITY_DN11113_c0_g3_i2.p1 TRINITY_DN11113_c0_g3~~TRINITY_DN11113_c0_g3_i2.p1  ORF type:complete len:260 (-),score=65.80 TRINITY_DN11113_c0_g3_i2:127-906(-)
MCIRDRTQSTWGVNQGEIKFDNFSARYHPRLPDVLHSLDLTIASGEKIGIVGRTGAGKSSIILALMRFINESGGQILLDGINHTRISLKRLRSQITVIPQDTYCFDGTLRENLDPLGKYSDTELEDALEKVGLLANVKPKGGLDMKVGENGNNLSAGEKQLLSISRALVKNSKIILLDEATSNIDPATEKVVQKALQEYFSKSTMLVIAHRINTVMASNKILFLADGGMREYDSPHSLLNNRQSEFAKLARELNNRPDK